MTMLKLEILVLVNYFILPVKLPLLSLIFPGRPTFVSLEHNKFIFFASMASTQMKPGNSTREILIVALLMGLQ